MKYYRIGEENYNICGTLMRIVEYKNNSNILVEFQDEYKARKSATYHDFKKGNIKNVYDKTIYNIGFLGEGKYNSKDYPYIYRKWYDMLKRCYDPYYLNKYPTYIDCYVCEEWHCYQNFVKWWEENVYNCNNERMELDKDILIKGNKIYSPNTCIIVPKRINYLFIKCDKSRGKYPIGVSWDKKGNKFTVQCRILNKENNNKRIHLGYYDTSEEAFLAYKQFKENYIKQIADEYKGLIPSKLYESMYSYEVEIDD